ncbi:MAG: hypothetical protein ACJ8DU_18240, partial [Microvirga sp.]
GELDDADHCVGPGAGDADALDIFARLPVLLAVGQEETFERHEAALAGASLDEPASWQVALDALSRDFTPLSDQRASATYRALVAQNLLFKALTEIASGGTHETRIGAWREMPDAAE